jgi:hypothetical protein
MSLDPDPYPMCTPAPCCICCGRPIPEGAECYNDVATTIHAGCFQRHTRRWDPRAKAWLAGRKTVAPPRERDA